MQIELWINEKKVKGEIEPDEILLDFLRKQGMTSVKRGCETSNCGLCTVFLDEKPVLSCSILAARAAGHQVTTLEGLQKEAEEFGAFIANQGAEQCGFCNPGLMMNAIAMFREYCGEDFMEVPGKNSGEFSREGSGEPPGDCSGDWQIPTEEQIKEYLAGNLCRCSGYEGQLRGIQAYLAYKRKKGASV